ncbi:MAG: C10 family peptidase [Prevotella sp.]|nr:C10 family peptidase [Prevotella sp.]
MKKSISIVALLAFFLQVSAQSVTKEAAQAKAKQFFSQQKQSSVRNTSARKIDAVLVPVTTTETKTVSLQKEVHSLNNKTASPYYIFNASDGQGYVIVSGDERAREILGYSESGTLSEQTMPCGMKLLLDMYVQEIEALNVADAAITQREVCSKTPKKVAENRTNISAMLSCQWGQDSPYNGQCPSSGYSRCIVGCAATATAQVMYYWGHQKGYDLASTAIPAYTTRELGLKCEELPATTFDWASMKDNSSSDAAAAKLCRYVGQALEMDYGTGSSEAWGSDIANVYRDYFGYDKHVRLVFRQDYDYNDYEQMMYDEMAAGRPVVITGSYIDDDGETWGGHSFVCDGYQASSGKYHINWGWDGSYDGYFALTALSGYYTSTSTKGCFNIYMNSVMGIQPPVEGHEYEEEESRAAIADMSLTGARSFSRENSEQDFEGITIFNGVYNHMQHNVELVAGLGVYDEAGKLLDVIAEAQLGRFDRYDGFGLEFTFGNLALGQGLKEGTYYIRSISKGTEDGDDWKLSTGAEHNYITATISETELTLQPSVDLEITSVGKTGSSNWNSTYGATITNNGTEESRGLLYAFSSSKLVNVVQTDIAAGETKTVTLASSSIVKITSDFDGHHVLWTNSSSVPNIALTAQAVNADRDGCFPGQTLVLDVSLANNGTSAYTTQVTVKLCKEGSSSAEATKTFPPNVASKSTQTERLEFENLVYNQPYTITLTSGSYTVEQGNMTTSQPRTFYVYTVTPVEKTVLLGDINEDGEVTIADVTALVNYLLGQNETAKFEVCDVNADGEVTIADVTALVNIILNK